MLPTFPMIAGGHVFTTDGATLLTLNERDGSPAWGPVTLPQASRLAYDGGRVFALGSGGALLGFDATTGAQLWQTQLSQSSFQSYPTAANGTVYVAGSGSSGGTLFAVAEQSGAVLWSQNVLGSGDSSPVVSSSGVYLAYPCPEVYDFDPGTGALLWHVGPGSCTTQGSGPRTAALFNGRLYVRDATSGLVLDAGTGAQLGVFRSAYPPAFSGSMAFYVGTGSVEGWDLTTDSMVWRWDGDALQVPSNGPRYYSAPTSAPVVVNGDLLFGIGQNVYALDGRTGRQLWTGATGTTNGPDSVAAGDGYAAVTSGGALTVFSSGGTPNPPSPTGADESVNHQVDAAHDGAQAGDPLAPPLSQKWAMDLGGAVTYPVIAGGQAYFAVAASGGGSQLHAVNLATGATAWGPVTLVGPVLGGQAMLATDNGRVFAQQSGVLHAFDAQSGLELWSRYVSINSSDSNSPSPVAAGGRLFAGPTRLDEETGAQLWRVNVGNSRLDVVTGTDVYVDGGCENTADLAVADGRQVWNHNGTTCSSGEPDLAPVLSGGRLYFHDFAPNSTMPLAILDAGTGAPVGTYAADTPAAITGGLAYWVKGGVLEAHNLTDLSLAWTFAGDGSLATAPVANGVVYVGSTNGNLYGVDAANGAQLWTAAAGSAMSAPDGIFATELTGLALGEGWLLVPAGTQLVAYSR